jgi:DGQHR domain-containing protein
MSGLDNFFSGSTISLGKCLLGLNLNAVTIRGYSSIGTLALISGPDTFDQFDNPLGTQRVLTKKHSIEAGAYAMTASAKENAGEVRIFPEVLLNVRDLAVIQIRDIETGRLLRGIDVKSISKSGTKMVEVFIVKKELAYPPAKFEPQIARVDGNHRLSQMTEYLRTGDFTLDEFPTVPFALHVGLDRHQETKIFVDINKNHKGMSTNLILTMGSTIGGSNLSQVVNKRAEYLAVELGKTELFRSIVDQGGDRAVFQSRYGAPPPITLTALRYCMRLLLSSAPQAAVRYRAEPDEFLKIIISYFEAIADVFPDSWGDKESSVLFHSIGLYGMSQLGGVLIERHHADQSLNRKTFIPSLKKIALKVSFERQVWYGIQGPAGGKKVFERCFAALNESGDNVK